MTLFRFLVTRLVTSYSNWWLNSLFSMNIGNEIDARLHTAISSAAVYSMISVHRFDERIVPRFFWFDLRLAASLYDMYGVAVSICDSRIFSHNSRALIVLRPFPWASYDSYIFSNSSP